MKLSKPNVQRLEEKKNVRALAKVLKDPDWDTSIRLSVVSALGEIGNLQAVETLIEALKDSNSSIRQAAVGTLSQLGWQPVIPTSLEPLVAALRDSDSNVREQAATALGELRDSRAVEPLVAALRDSDSNVREQAAEVLINLGSVAVEPLAAILRDSHWSVSEQIAATLNGLGTPRAVELLAVAQMRDSDWRVRRRAVAALISLGSVAVKPLVAALGDSDWSVRRRAIEALISLGSVAVEPLVSALGDNNSTVRERAVEALERIHDPQGLEALRNYQQEDSRSSQMKDHRQEAIVSFNKILALDPYYLEPRYSNTPLLSEMDKANEDIEDLNDKEISIVISRHYRHLVEFSLVSIKGLHEILQMYIEIVKIHLSVPWLIRQEATSFRNDYCLTLVPNFKSYPLLPPTLTNSRDTWILKGKEVDLFGIKFDWPHMTSMEVVVKAEVFDHRKKERKIISSSIITLERNGERPTETSFVPKGTFMQMSPYLYKLLTVEGLCGKITGNEKQLNNAAFEEIAAIFDCEPLDLINQMVDRTHDRVDLIFKANINPLIAEKLIEVARIIRNHVDIQKTAPSALPIKIFYCYAHEDKDLRDRIEKHLALLKRLGQITGWYDREIRPGTDWRHEIRESLSTSDIVLLLVSANFMHSDYCWGIEMEQALELHRTGQIRVLPIILQPVDWEGAPFSTLQMLPTDAKPVTAWANQEDALKDIAKNIRGVVRELQSQKK